MAGEVEPEIDTRPPCVSLLRDLKSGHVQVPVRLPHRGARPEPPPRPERRPPATWDRRPARAPRRDGWAAGRRDRGSGEVRAWPAHSSPPCAGCRGPGSAPRARRRARRHGFASQPVQTPRELHVVAALLRERALLGQQLTALQGPRRTVCAPRTGRLAGAASARAVLCRFCVRCRTSALARFLPCSVHRSPRL